MCEKSIIFERMVPLDDDVLECIERVSALREEEKKAVIKFIESLSLSQEKPLAPRAEV